MMFFVKASLRLLLILCIPYSGDALVPFGWKETGRQRFCSNNDKATCVARHAVASNTALTPIGPFCPFRSPAADALEDQMEELSALGPVLATAMTRVQLELMQATESKNPPNGDLILETADTIDKAVTKWETVLTHIRGIENRWPSLFKLTHSAWVVVKVPTWRKWLPA